MKIRTPMTASMKFLFIFVVIGCLKVSQSIGAGISEMLQIPIPRQAIVTLFSIAGAIFALIFLRSIRLPDGRYIFPADVETREEHPILNTRALLIGVVAVSIIYSFHYLYWPTVRNWLNVQ